MSATNAQNPELVRQWGRLETSYKGLDALIRAAFVGPEKFELAPVNAWVGQLHQQLSEDPSVEGFVDIDHTLASIESHCEPYEKRRPENRPNWVTAALRIVREMREALKTVIQAKNIVNTVKVLAELFPSQPTAAGAKSQAPSNSTPAVVTQQRARLFIGSSVEGLPVANQLQALLEHDADVTVWHQGVFSPSSGSLESLVGIAPTFDFAVLVLTPDDVVTKRDKSKNAPRDNVLFELGLFIGSIGPGRTYFVHPREDMALPSDLAGITPLTYDANRSDGNLCAALGPAANSVRSKVGRLGPRPK